MKKGNPKAVFKTNKCHLGLCTVRCLFIRQMLCLSVFLFSLHLTGSLAASFMGTAVCPLAHLPFCLGYFSPHSEMISNSQQTHAEHLRCARHCAGKKWGRGHINPSGRSGSGMTLKDSVFSVYSPCSPGPL